MFSHPSLSIEQYIVVLCLCLLLYLFIRHEVYLFVCVSYIVTLMPDLCRSLFSIFQRLVWTFREFHQVLPRRGNLSRAPGTWSRTAGSELGAEMRYHTTCCSASLLPPLGCEHGQIILYYVFFSFSSSSSLWTIWCWTQWLRSSWPSEKTLSNLLIKLSKM